MTLGPGDLVLCSGTLPRDVPFRQRLEAAAAAGFAGISLWGRDYWGARAEGLNDVDIRTLLDDHGLAAAELDPAWWWLPGAAEIGASIPSPADDQKVFSYGEDEMFRIGEVVGARSINAVDVFGGSWSIDEAAAAFAGLADRAAEHGLLVHVEFLPWSKIPDVATAAEIVRLADRANGGIAVDAWHYFRGRPDDRTLRAIPGERVFNIQLDDGPAQPEANLLAATLHDRLLPGDGDFDLSDLLAVLVGINAQAPIGAEVFSDKLHATGAHEAARLAGESLRALMARTPTVP
jgi:sugar phosphate isomerase/epimerase